MGPALVGPGAPAARSVTASGANALGADLTLWNIWWNHNKAPYLELKTHVHSPGAMTGDVRRLPEQETRPDLRPTEQQVRERIVPALLAVLEQETNNDLVTGALIALAKVGDGGGIEDSARFVSALARFLADKNQEIRETSAVSLGILANPRATPTLANLLWDTEQGRELVKQTEVDYRTRAFAAYGLGLIGARATSESDRKVILAVLRRALDTDQTATPDLAVACVVAYSIVPLSAIGSSAALDVRNASMLESSRREQLEYLLALLRDRERHVLVRAQCPIALARVLSAPADGVETFRAEIAAELMQLIERDRERAELIQSCVLALGQLGTNAGRGLDAKIRATLEDVAKKAAEPQARGFALIAMAQVGGRFGADPSAAGLEDAADFLIDQMLDGKSAQRSWAGLASGVLGYELARSSVAAPALERLQRVVRTLLTDERDPSNRGAFAIAAGLLGDQESGPLLLKYLTQEIVDETRGQIATGLALMRQREALEPLRRIIGESTYKPLLLAECSMAAAILEDKEAPPMLAQLLERANGLAAEASISTALGYIGDVRSVDALLRGLGPGQSAFRTDCARGFAAVGLGNVADKESLPWNSKLALGLNYRAATATLTEPAVKKGILDIL